MVLSKAAVAETETAIREILKRRRSLCEDFRTVTEPAAIAARIPEFVSALYAISAEAQILAIRLPEDSYLRKDAFDSEIFNIAPHIYFDGDIECWKRFCAHLRTPDDLGDFLSRAIYAKQLRKEPLAQLQRLLTFAISELQQHPAVCDNTAARAKLIGRICNECCDFDAVQFIVRLQHHFSTEMLIEAKQLYTDSLRKNATKITAFLTRTFAECVWKTPKQSFALLKTLASDVRLHADAAFIRLLLDVTRIAQLQPEELLKFAYTTLAPGGHGTAFLRVLKLATANSPLRNLSQLVRQTFQLDAQQSAKLNADALVALAEQSQFRVVQQLLQKPKSFPVNLTRSQETEMLRQAVRKSEAFFIWFLTTPTFRRASICTFASFFREIFAAHAEKSTRHLLTELTELKKRPSRDTAWETYCASFRTTFDFKKCRFLLDHFSEEIRAAFQHALAEEKQHAEERLKPKNRHKYYRSAVKDFEYAVQQYVEQNTDNAALPSLMQFISTTMPIEQLPTFLTVLLKQARRYSDQKAFLSAVLFQPADESIAYLMERAFSEYPYQNDNAAALLAVRQKFDDMIQRRTEVIRALRGAAIPVECLPIFDETLTSCQAATSRFDVELQTPVAIRLLVDANLETLATIQAGIKMCQSFGITYDNFQSHEATALVVDAIQKLRPTSCRKTRLL